MSSDEFRLAAQQVGVTVWVLTVSGDCGQAAGADLGRQVGTLDADHGPAFAVIDLTGATVVRNGFCDPLVDSARAARARGISTTVVTEDGSVRERLGSAADEGALRIERVLATGIRDALIASLA